MFALNSAKPKLPAFLSYLNYLEIKGCIKKENTRFKQHQKERIGNIVSLKNVDSMDNIKTLELTEIGENKINSQ